MKITNLHRVRVKMSRSPRIFARSSTGRSASIVSWGLDPWVFESPEGRCETIEWLQRGASNGSKTRKLVNDARLADLHEGRDDRIDARRSFPDGSPQRCTACSR